MKAVALICHNDYLSARDVLCYYSAIIMADNKKQQRASTSSPHKTTQDAKKKALEAALRANLKRRKAASKAAE